MHPPLLHLPMGDPPPHHLRTRTSYVDLPSVNNDTSFVIDTMGHKSSEFDVIITGPADAVPPYEAIPLRCYQQKDGRLLVEFRYIFRYLTHYAKLDT